MATTLDLLREWEERERLLIALAEYFRDGHSKSYAEGCLFATRRCLDELRAGGGWVNGYEAGFRKALKERREEPPSADAVDPHADSTGKLSTLER